MLTAHASCAVPFPGSGGGYRPRVPEESVVYRVVQENLETFLAQQRDGGRWVPGFVEREMRAFLECGIPAFGFLRLQCESCKQEKLVPFSCKRRAACSSCCGRRMADTAAHLVDRVFPRVPVRQWVLSLPFALRYKLAYDAERTTAVLGVFVRAVFAFLRKMGRDYGVHETQCGAVTFIQRYGGALNLNPHFHVLAIDGVYAPDAEGNPKFYELRQPTDAEIAGLTETVAIRIGELVQRRALETAGSGDEETDRLFREQPWLSKLYASSVSNRTATGPNAGQRTLRTGDRLDPEALETLGERTSPLCASFAGFNLHAAVVVPARDRQRLEKLCQYAARPPFAADRLEELPDGRLSYRFKTPWRDGTTHGVFTKLEFIEKLAALVPTPRAHLVRYHGVLGPAAKWRPRIVPEVPRPAETAPPKSAPPEKDATEPAAPSEETQDSATPRRRGRKNYTWAELLKRVFAVDVTICGCGGKLRLISAIHPPTATRKILEHLGLPSRPPPLTPATRTLILDWN